MPPEPLHYAQEAYTKIGGKMKIEKTFDMVTSEKTAKKVEKICYYFLIALIFIVVGYLWRSVQLPTPPTFSQVVQEEMMTGTQKFSVGNLTFVPTKKPNVWLVEIKHGM